MCIRDRVRFKHLGSAHTEAKFVYNHLNGRYWPCEEDVIHTPQGEQDVYKRQWVL